MNHEEAVRLGASEKYVLGELSSASAGDFEEHYFSCPECAGALKAAAAFAGASRLVFFQDQQRPSADTVPAKRGWLSWLRPTIVVPAFAALVLVLGYQNFVSIPHLKDLAAQPGVPQLLPTFSLLSANTRGAAPQAFQVRASQSFGLYVDVPPEPPFPNYLLRLEDARHQARLLLPVTAAAAKSSLLIDVPGNFPPGRYDLVVFGLSQQAGAAGGSTELARYPFAIEFGSRNDGQQKLPETLNER